VPQTHPRPSSVWAAAEPFDLGTFTGLHLGCRETTSLLPTPTDQLGRRSPALAKSLRDLQGAVRELLETRCPPGVTVREAQQRLGVGRRLAWSIVSFQRASTADDMTRVLPGRRGWDWTTNTVTVYSWSYQDDGSPITIGPPSAVPGGVGLSALAIGAAGLRGRRRSRN
jgi:hypothetical protein